MWLLWLMWYLLTNIPRICADVQLTEGPPPVRHQRTICVIEMPCSRKQLLPPSSHRKRDPSEIRFLSVNETRSSDSYCWARSAAKSGRQIDRKSDSTSRAVINSCDGYVANIQGSPADVILTRFSCVGSNNWAHNIL